MFCPWCGASTEIRDGYLYCSATGMEFSAVVHRELTAIAHSPPASAEPTEIRWGGGWRCPADSSLMVEADGRVICPTCKRTLPPRLLYGLIEFHVHPTTSG